MALAAEAAEEEEEAVVGVDAVHFRPKTLKTSKGSIFVFVTDGDSAQSFWQGGPTARAHTVSVRSQ